MGIIGFLSKEAGEFQSLLSSPPPGPLLVLNLPAFICLRITCQLNLVIACVIRKQTIPSTLALQYLCVHVCVWGIQYVPVGSTRAFHFDTFPSDAPLSSRIFNPDLLSADASSELTAHLPLPHSQIATSGATVTFKITHVQTISLLL